MYKARIKTACLGLFGLALLIQVQLFAAKGDAKEKKGVVLKFSGFDLKSINASTFTLKPGLVYKGSFSNIVKSPQETTIQSIITYKKGNTTFIYPYQHKVTIPKFKTPQQQKF